MIYYHGSWTGGPLDPQLGLCLTDELDSAHNYARGIGGGPRGVVNAVDLDMEDLAVYPLDEHPAEEEWELIACPDDTDVIAYPDCDECGMVHETVRLMSAAALASITSITVVGELD